MQLEFSGSEVDTIALALQLQVPCAQNLLLSIQRQVHAQAKPADDQTVSRPSGE